MIILQRSSLSAIKRPGAGLIELRSIAMKYELLDKYELILVVRLQDRSTLPSTRLFEDIITELVDCLRNLTIRGGS